LQFRVVKADQPEIVEIGFGVDELSDLADIVSRLKARGIRAERSADALSVVDPVNSIPLRIALAPRLPAEGGKSQRRTDRSNLVPRSAVRPVRLGHVVVGCSDVEAATSFYLDCLGLQLSDYVESAAFMRFTTDHHNVMMLPAKRTYLHHTAWKVHNVDEIGYGATNMIRIDKRRDCWGFGRHDASANYFWYLSDPNGSLAEYYYSELDELVDDPKWWDPPPDLGPLAPAAWGPPIPQVFRAPPASRGAVLGG
jgi:catechol 2,3-dioxygenase-like lactoylglutathione lyase family enzyme